MPSLLDLPGELRNRIYSLALVKGEPVEPQRRSHRFKEYTAMAFSKTNKQIYEESIKLYYSSNVFLFRCEMPMGFNHQRRCRLKADLARFFDSMPAERRGLVERVELKTQSEVCLS